MFECNNLTVGGIQLLTFVFMLWTWAAP